LISARFGHFLDRPLSPIIRHIRIDPNILTITGFIIVTVAALIIPSNLFFGGILLLIGSIFDMLDGISARVNGRVTRFGAFLDSLLDRYSDALLFLSIAWYLASKGDHSSAFLSIGSMLGSFFVSYARARAEGLGIDGQTGLMERPERLLLLIFGTLSGWLSPILWVIFILTQITVIQRAYAVWKAER
jgi:phosphatidylglycerophosphate synthase